MKRARFPVVVHVLLLRNHEVFLLRRANTGFLDGYFVLPGGYQETGEAVSAAAARECEEEAGVRPEHLLPVCALPWRSEQDQGLNFVFEAPAGSLRPILAEPGRFDHAGWFALDALPQPLAPWIEEALRMRARGDWFVEFGFR